MSHKDARVDPQPLPLDARQVLREGGPLPVEAALQHLDIDALDAGEHAGQEVAVGGPAGGQRIAAVPGQDRRDAVPGRAGQEAAPQHLGVVVGVDIDEAWGDDGPLGVDDTSRPAVHATHGGDTPLDDGHIGPAPGHARAVGHRAVLDDQVVGHGAPPAAASSVSLVPPGVKRRDPGGESALPGQHPRSGIPGAMPWRPFRPR
jgi:hypothetical protein